VSRRTCDNFNRYNTGSHKAPLIRAVGARLWFPPPTARTCTRSNCLGHSIGPMALMRWIAMLKELPRALHSVQMNTLAQNQ
jgi:hypothetical protein